MHNYVDLKARISIFLKHASTLGNFINIAKTLAYRHQYLLVHYLQSPSCMLETGPGMLTVFSAT